MEIDKLPTLIVSGPTASGKSCLSQAIAKQFSGEIINADSMQVYKELRILSARPGNAETDLIPHHLYGHIPISSAYSAGIWLEQAKEAITAILHRKNLPILCGGTGLYIKVLNEGITPTPAIDQRFIKAASTLYDNQGKNRALSILKASHPKKEIDIHLNDRQRIIRALSIFFATGRTLEDWHKNQPHGPRLDISRFTINLIPSRKDLYLVINQRFDKMIADGGIEEVRAIMEQRVARALQAMKAVGVPELYSYLSHNISLETAVLKAKQATRNLAKRQLSWLRNHSKPDLTINDFASKNSIELSLSAVRKFIESQHT